jgi:hypothetical protein
LLTETVAAGSFISFPETFFILFAKALLEGGAVSEWLRPLLAFAGAG